MLTGPKIADEVAAGRIAVSGFDPKKVNPNSYNLSLSHQLLIYRKVLPLHHHHELNERRRQAFPLGVVTQTPPPVLEPLDMSQPEPTEELEIPPAGLVLYPGVLYLGCTREVTETRHHVPMIEGRSGVGRLGLFVHVTAGFGDQNHCGTWTLEIVPVVPIRVFSAVEVCQIAYTVPDGPTRDYDGSYQNQTVPRPSNLWREVQKMRSPQPTS